MEINIAGIETDSVVDGTGIRTTFFLQGCPHHCKGCHNPQTWDYNKGTLYEIDELIETYVIPYSDFNTGITISGGEPFIQIEPLKEFVNKAKKYYQDIWIYTGYTAEQLITMNIDDLLSQFTVIVTGKFIEELKSFEKKWAGSTNQELVKIINKEIIYLKKFSRNPISFS